MGYNLNFDEIRNLQASLMSSVAGWQELYSQIGEELTGFVWDTEYAGAGGTAIRNYVQEVHGVVCQSLSLLLAEYIGRLLLFGEGLYEYDSDKHACLNEDALAAVAERLGTVAEDLGGLHETARREMQKITDQVDTNCRSGVEEYVSVLYNKRTELREYRERVGEYDHTSAVGLEEMKELASSLRRLVDRLYEGGEIRAEAWEPGSFLTGEELEHLAGLVINSGRFLMENGDAVSAAYEHYTRVWEEIIEELSEERVKQGVLLVLASAVAIAGVILSAGTLAPVVTATLGTAVVAYSSSNLLEGAQDIYYGLNEDPYTVAYNPMCETVFQGNREAYDLFGLTVNSAYAVVVPLNQFACASTTTGQFMVLVDVGAGVVTDMGVTRICEATGADEMTTFVMGLGAGMVTGMAVDSLNPSVPRRPGSMEMDSGELHTTISELQRRGYLGDGNSLPSSFADMMSPEDVARHTYYLENGNSLPSTFADLMSPEDAARYTHFLEYGSNSGLTPTELAGIRNVDDFLVLRSVDYDEVLALRRQSSVGFGDTGSTSFSGRLRGEIVTLPDITIKGISYVKRSNVELYRLRNEFNTTIRKAFLKNLGQNVEFLKKAGFSDVDILKIQNGRVPDGWQIHHKLPLDDSGTNSFDNLVLIQNEPYHKVITNYQNSITRQMEVGNMRVVQWPIPNGNIYPAKH